MISLNLGLLNLLPVPVLDGGHIAILAVEGLFRRDLSLRVKERILHGRRRADRAADGDRDLQRHRTAAAIETNNDTSRHRAN